MSTNNTIENLVEGVMRHGPEILAKCVSDAEELAQYRTLLETEFLNYEIPKTEIDINNWLVPHEYCPDLTAILYEMCTTDEQKDRVSLELDLFIKNGMYDILHVMKYIVDTLRANNIVWGVGRGSSVASYVLHLIGVHKIDSIKYELPIEEFFKGEQNG
jgi:DNA polymerase III alpha subunit